MVRFAGIVLAATVAALPSLATAQERSALVYEVREGDTLIALADRYLQRRADWLQIQRLNEIRNPRRLPIGQSLKLPRDLLSFDPVELRVAAFSGPVRLSGSATAVGARLTEGDVVSTGPDGFVTFTTGSGGRISVPSNSTARLVRARRYRLDEALDVDFLVDGGRGRISFPPLRGQDTLQMRTRQAVTAVRGTDFRVAYDAQNDRSITEVVEGIVGVAAGDAEVSTKAGFGVSITAEGLGRPEPLLPPPPLVDPGAIQTAEQLTFRLAPEASAPAHRFQLARDAGFLDIVDSEVIEGEEATFPDLPNGRYFIRARSISDNGIEGLSETYSFRRKRLGVTASVAPSQIEDGFLFKWLPEGSERASFAFQLWRGSDSSALLVDETGLDITSLVLTDLAPGTYEWRVAAIEAEPEGLLKVWGETQTLNVSE